jgi:hypothetical protein
MRRHPNSHSDRVAADLIQRVREPLELIVARTARRPRAHVAFPQRGAERLEEIACERNVVGNRLRNLIGIDEVRRLPLGAVRAIDERDAGVVEHLLEHHRIFPILLDVVRVRLDALQSQRRDSLDGPCDVVLPAPDGAGRAEENVGIHRIEGLVIHRAPHARRPEDARRRRHGG